MPIPECAHTEWENFLKEMNHDSEGLFDNLTIRRVEFQCPVRFPAEVQFRSLDLANK